MLTVGCDVCVGAWAVQVRQGVVIVTPLEGEDERTTRYNAYIKYLFEPCGLMKFLEEKVS